MSLAPRVSHFTHEEKQTQRILRSTFPCNNSNGADANISFFTIFGLAGEAFVRLVAREEENDDHRFKL